MRVRARGVHACAYARDCRYLCATPSPGTSLASTESRTTAWRYWQAPSLRKCRQQPVSPLSIFAKTELVPRDQRRWLRYRQKRERESRDCVHARESARDGEKSRYRRESEIQGGEREREGGREGERESVCVCAPARVLFLLLFVAACLFVSHYEYVYVFACIPYDFVHVIYIQSVVCVHTDHRIKLLAHLHTRRPYYRTRLSVV